MLELRTYTKQELSQIFKATDNQGIKRKLSRYGIQYTTQGRGEQITFTITQVPDPFKVFCIQHLDFNGQTEFRKLRNFLYYFFNDDEFQILPDETKATLLSEKPKPFTKRCCGTTTTARQKRKFQK